MLKLGWLEQNQVRIASAQSASRVDLHALALLQP
jgi:hypothetical protein